MLKLISFEVLQQKEIPLEWLHCISISISLYRQNEAKPISVSRNHFLLNCNDSHVVLLQYVFDRANSQMPPIISVNDSIKHSRVYTENKSPRIAACFPDTECSQNFERTTLPLLDESSSSITYTYFKGYKYFFVQ